MLLLSKNGYDREFKNVEENVGCEVVNNKKLS